MRNPHELAFCVMLHSSSCFLVCITYWESVPYKKSQDGDRRFLHGDLGILKIPMNFFLCDFAFFLLSYL